MDPLKWNISSVEGVLACPKVIPIYGKLFSFNNNFPQTETYGLRMQQMGNSFTFLLQTDPTHGNFCPSNGYVCPFDRVMLTLHSTDSVDSEIVSHLWDPFVGLCLKTESHKRIDLSFPLKPIRKQTLYLSFSSHYRSNERHSTVHSCRWNCFYKISCISRAISPMATRPCIWVPVSTSVHLGRTLTLNRNCEVPPGLLFMQMQSEAADSLSPYSVYSVPATVFLK